AHRSALVQDRRLVLPGVETADAGADARTAVLTRDVFLAQPCVFEGVGRSYEGELNEAVDPLRLLALHVGRDVDVDLARDANAQCRRVEERDLTDAVPGLVLSGQERLGPHTDRCDRT